MTEPVPINGTPKFIYTEESSKHCSLTSGSHSALPATG